MVEEKKKREHYWSYCEQCQVEMVKCGTCGNNCCNGGFGQINGKECQDCVIAYAKQDNERSLHSFAISNMKCNSFPNKARYVSIAEANRVVLLMAKDMKQLIVYHCNTCNGYHLASKK